jgi:hypothetical protein
MLVAESPDAAITRERNHEENNAKAAFACCRSLARCGIDRPAAAAGRMPEGQSAWLPPLPAMRRDRRIAPRRNNRLIYRRPEGRHLSRGKPDPAIDFGATKIDGARLFALQFLKNEGPASNGKARRISLRPVFGL